jgi:hypothetical protein
MTTAAEDELAVRDLVARFTDAVNRRAHHELEALFVEDGEWVVPGIAETRGGPAAAALLGRLLDGFPFLIQLVGSGRVRIDGDRGRARWYLTEYARDGEGSAWFFAGTYHDVLARSAEGWRFVSRRFDFLYRGRVDLPGKATPFVLPPAPGGLPWPD